MASIQLDKHFAAPGETITATVTVFGGGADGAKKEPVNATVTGRIEVWSDSDAGAAGGPSPGGAASGSSYQPLEAVTFTKLEGGPGTRFAAKFIPSSFVGLAKAQRDAQIAALVSVNGKPPTPVRSSFQYTAAAPVVVLDRHSDALVDGSLEVTLVFDVKKLGQEIFTATLFDSTGKTPIAIHEGRYLPSTLGPQEVKLTFFGRNLALKAIDGPYTVAALHGSVRDEAAQPPQIVFSSTASIVTNAYKASDFSSKEWDSPEKQAKINLYKALITKTEARKQ